MPEVIELRYHANPSTPKVRAAMSTGLIDCIVTPKQGNRIPEGAWICADNGVFGKGYPGDDEWWAWLQTLPTERCRFAVAPDVVAVVTDVVRENNQTYRLGWTEMSKDGTKMGVGSPEYILLFHKPQTDRSRGYADTPVTKDKERYTRARWQVDAHAFWRSSGDRPITPEELAGMPVDQRSKAFTEQTLREVYDYESHIKVGEILDGKGALPAAFMSLAPGSWHPEVWHDVNRMLTLNTEQSRRALTMHVCPLQFDIVDRLIGRFSNPGELVFDPFGGLFTVPVRALHAGRRGRAVELNPGYFLDGVKYLEAEERNRAMPSLFEVAS